MSAGRRQRGFALLIVLWTMATLSLLATQVTSAGRTEARLAANLRAQAVASAAADGAIEEAAFRLAVHAWPADDAERGLVIGGVPVRVRIEDQSGKINPNRVPRPLMEGLLRALGVAPANATRIALGIEDFRQRNVMSLLGGQKLAPYVAAGLPYGPAQRPYTSLDEVGLALGMTPALLERVRPFLSVYQAFNAAPAQAADGARQALEDLPATPTVPGLAEAQRAVTLAVVTATAGSDRGAVATRTATIRVRAAPPGQGGQPGSPVSVLTWE